MWLSRQEHSLRISVPVPAKISPENVLSVLHDHGRMMSMQPLVTHWEELPSEPGSPTKRYSFTEAIPILPFLGAWGSKAITSEATFENTEDGVRSVADAPAGVVVRAEWRIEHAKDDGGRSGADKEEHDEQNKIDWVLTEDVSVECAAVLMWFVKGQMEQAHQDICRKVLESAETRNEDSAAT